MNQDHGSAMDVNAIRTDVHEQAGHHVDVLRAGLRASCGGVETFQRWMGAELQRLGMEVSGYRVDDAELLDQPAQRKTLLKDPSALTRGTNVVGRLRGHRGDQSPGQAPGPGILLFGHADKSPAGYAWGQANPDLVEVDGRLEGAGIADDVAGLTSMLGAVETFLRLGFRPRGDLLLASVLGKQMGVFGTYGLVRRFPPVGAAPVGVAIYAHPAESGNGLGDLKIASLGIAEFSLTVGGRRPDTSEPHHAIHARTGVSALDKGIYLLQGLARWAAEQNELPGYRHPELEERTGQSFAVLFGRLLAGAGSHVYEVPTRCVVQGVISFSPAVRLAQAQDGFERALRQLVQADPWLSKDHIQLEWGDLIAESCQSDAGSEPIQTATQVMAEVTGKEPVLHYGHSASDLRYPILWWGAQAMGLGPTAGDVGGEHEYVDRKEYLETIVVIAELLRRLA